MAQDILIVDDESDIRSLIAGILEDEGYETREAATSQEAFLAIGKRQPNLIILDVWLQDSELDGLQMLERIRKENPAQQVLMISGHATFDMAVNATKMGAYDFLTKPFKTDVLIHTIGRAVEDIRLREENESLRARSGNRQAELTGSSAIMTQLRSAIEKVAGTDSRVLISGPPGSGKGVVASVLHAQSERKSGPFVVMSCAGLDPKEVDHSLFGREADREKVRRVGAYEKAHRGTLVLDEVGDPAHEGFLVVPHAEVGTIVAVEGPAVGHQGGLLGHLVRIHGVVLGADHQGRHRNLAEAVGDVPVDEAPAHAEFAWALHQIVELVVEPLERAGDGLGPLLEAADVLGVEVVVDQLQELLVLDVPGLLIGNQSGQDLRVHLRT